MEKQPKTSGGSILEAFIALQAELPVVERDRQNPFFKSNYATYQAIVAVLRPLCAKYALGYRQGLAYVGEHAVWRTTIFNADGEEIVSDIEYRSKSDDPQRIGSTVTYYRRYGLQAAFGIVVAYDDDDDDGNKASGKAPW